MIKTFKILISAIVCALTLSIINFWMIPLVFCAILMIFNLKTFNFLLMIKFIVASYISFSISILIYILIGNLLELVFDQSFQIGKFRVVDISFLISVCIFSPVLFFLINTFVFEVLRISDNFKSILLGSSIILLSFIFCHVYNYRSDIVFRVWQIVVALLFQYILFYKNSKEQFQIED